MSAVVSHLQLRDRFLADDRLMQQHMIQHRTERIVGVRRASRDLDRLRDRDAEAAVAVGRAREHAGRKWSPTRARDTARAKRLHERAAIRLLVADTRTMNTRISMPNIAPANASADPHCPAPVSVAIFLMPASLL